MDVNSSRQGTGLTARWFDLHPVVHAFLLFVLGKPALSVHASEMLVAEFGWYPHTAQGEWFECWGASPNVIFDELCDLGEPSRDTWRVVVTDLAESGTVGASIPMRLPSRGPAADDASPHYSAVLCLMGELGQRSFRVSCQTQKENSSPLHLGEIAASQLDGNRWRTLTFRLPRNLAVDQTLELRLTAEGTGHAWLAVDRLVIRADDSGESAPDQVQQPQPQPHKLRTAMWVWNTEEILAASGETAELLRFCEAEQITDLFLQAVYFWKDATLKFHLVEEQRRFIAQAHERQIRVHLLDGAPQYVLADNHARMLALIEAVIALNAKCNPEECYDAVHLDNEPYVLEAWQDPQQRMRILADYVTLNQTLYQRTRAAGLEYGIDIPFWFDLQSSTGEYVYTVESGGKRVPLLESLFGCVDNIGIMAYRPRALGPNGIIAQAWNEIQLGDHLGVDVITAVELGTGADVEPGTSFGPYNLQYFAGQMRTLRRVLAREPGCAGIAIHHYIPYQRMVVSSD